MEEVDQIILNSLLNIGCEFAEGLESLKQLTTENVVEATVRCLKIISPDLKMSHIFPPGMSARFRVGSAIAQACQSVGYRDDIGYQTFLYSSEVDIRKIFMFLIEKLPRKEGIKEDGDSSSVLKRRIGQVLQEQCASTWLPFYCHRKKNKIRFTTYNLNYLSKHGPDPVASFIHLQLDERSILIPYMLEQSTKGFVQQFAQLTQKEAIASKEISKQSFQWKKMSILSDQLSFNTSFEDVLLSLSGKTSHIKQSRFANAKKLQFTEGEIATKKRSKPITKPTIARKPSHLESLNEKGFQNRQEASLLAEENHTDNREHLEETEEEKFEREETELKEFIVNAEKTQVEHKEEIVSMQATFQQVKLEIINLESDNMKQRETFDLKKKTAHLLPNADESMGKLKSLIERSSGRLLTLGKLWEERRVPMIKEIRNLKKKSYASEFDCEKKVEEIKDLRQRMKETGDETKRKERMVKQLIDELKSLKRDISRQSYTKRIMEIVTSIHKQQAEIEHVIADMKEAQKQMNHLKGRIDRTFAAVDEVMFKDTKKDDSIRQAYKYLVSLHDNCNALVDTVQHTGAIMREIRDLEDQIEIETKKNAEENLLKIMQDYKEIKKENMELMKQLKHD